MVCVVPPHPYVAWTVALRVPKVRHALGCAVGEAMILRKRQKFNAKRQNYNGHQYDSRAEAQVAAELDLRVKARDIRGYRRQVTVPLIVNGKRVCAMRVDFVLEHNDGSEEHLEVKGFQTPEWLIKRKLFEALYPEKVYTVRRV